MRRFTFVFIVLGAGALQAQDVPVSHYDPDTEQQPSGIALSVEKALADAALAERMMQRREASSEVQARALIMAAAPVLGAALAPADPRAVAAANTLFELELEARLERVGFPYSWQHAIYTRLPRRRLPTDAELAALVEGTRPGATEIPARIAAIDRALAATAASFGDDHRLAADLLELKSSYLDPGEAVVAKRKALTILQAQDVRRKEQWIVFASLLQLLVETGQGEEAAASLRAFFAAVAEPDQDDVAGLIAAVRELDDSTAAVVAKRTALTILQAQDVRRKEQWIVFASLLQLLVETGQGEEAAASLRAFFAAVAEPDQDDVAGLTAAVRELGESTAMVGTVALIERVGRAPQPGGQKFTGARGPSQKVSEPSVAGKWIKDPPEASPAEMRLVDQLDETTATSGKDTRGALLRALSLTRRLARYSEGRRDPYDHADHQGEIGRTLMELGREPEALVAFRAAVAAAEADAQLNGNNPGFAYEDLIACLERMGELAAAEEAARQALAASLRFAGGEDESASEDLILIGDLLRRQGRTDAALVEYERAAAIRGRLLGLDHPKSRLVADRIVRARAGSPLPPAPKPGTPGFFRPELAFEKAPDAPSNPRETANPAVYALWDSAVSAFRERRDADALEALDNIEALMSDGTSALLVDAARLRAKLLVRRGRLADAEASLRRTLARTEQSDGRLVTPLLVELGDVHLRQLLPTLAEQVYRRARAIGGYSDSDALDARLADAIELQSRPADAEPIRRQLLFNSGGEEIASTVALAGNLSMQGRTLEALELLDGAGSVSLTTSVEMQAARPDVRDRMAAAATATRLIELLIELGRPEQAARMAEAALAASGRSGAPDNRILAELSALAGRALLDAGSPGRALDLLRPACETLLTQSRRFGAEAGDELAANRTLQRCAAALALAARKVDAVSRTSIEEGVVAMQLSELSTAGVALSRAGARAAAKAAGAGELVERYEEALIRRSAIAGRGRILAVDAGAADSSERRRAVVEGAELDRHIDQLIRTIETQYPAYAQLRLPKPVGLAELQGPNGLLKPGEAVLLFLTPPGTARGLVAAVSRDSVGWADIGMTGDELASAVADLRWEIDPQSFGPGNSGDRQVFDRASAHRLHNALLGAPEIAAVIRPAKSLIFVPSGPLTSLPPGLLVTAPPQGSDDDAVALRGTAWLLRRYSIAVLPALPSIRLLRRGAPAPGGRGLVAFADPDFTATRTDEVPVSRPSTRLRAADVLRDGIAGQAELAQLPQLPGTRREGEELAKLLGADQGNLFFGRNASETALRQAERSGRLSRAAVLAFATHGLVAGEFGLAEPALVLARPDRSSAEDDGLLLSSEAMSLRLDAEWVLLSACNTASPNGHGAGGLSGLVRSFFFAGARNVLASHWRVNDDAAARIVTSLFAPEHRHLPKAEALRRAAFAVLDDKSFPAGAEPFFWAPYVLIGMPD